jgi:PqqA family protein
MTRMKSEAKSRRKTWIKPEFEYVDLCCEVTLYLHQ